VALGAAFSPKTDEYKEVKESDEMEVDSLLLGFSDLNEAQQAVFLEGLNRYLFVSPSRRRQLRLCWKKSCVRDESHTVGDVCDCGGGVSPENA
jgi:hypothetical protein